MKNTLFFCFVFKLQIIYVREIYQCHHLAVGVEYCRDLLVKYKSSSSSSPPAVLGEESVGESAGLR